MSRRVNRTEDFLRLALAVLGLAIAIAGVILVIGSIHVDWITLAWGLLCLAVSVLIGLKVFKNHNIVFKAE